MIIVEAVGGARAIVNLEPMLKGTKLLENELKFLGITHLRVQNVKG
jgi:hypothetical protein